MELLTVNDVIDRHFPPGAPCIHVTGVLTFDFEDVSLAHWPKAERDARRQGIWIEPDGPAFTFEEELELGTLRVGL